MVCWTWLAAVRLRGHLVPPVRTMCASSERMGSMSFPQPPNDPQFHQPGYPPPPAPASGANTMNAAAIMAPENRAYLIAGGGGLLALIAYFFLPFYGSSYTGPGLTGGTTTSSSTITGSQLASGYALLNLVWI